MHTVSSRRVISRTRRNSQFDGRRLSESESTNRRAVGIIDLLIARLEETRVGQLMSPFVNFERRFRARRLQVASGPAKMTRASQAHAKIVDSDSAIGD